VSIYTVEGHAHTCIIDGHSFVWDARCHESPIHYKWAVDGPEFCTMHNEGIEADFGKQATTVRGLYLRIARLEAAVNRLYEAPAPATTEEAR